MNKHHHPTEDRTNKGRTWAGIIILGIGVILLAGRLGLGWLFPHWIFNWHNLWPLTLIVVGLLIGGNSNFRNPVAVFLICFGGFFLLKEIFGFNIGPLIGPAIIISIGLWLLLGRGKRIPHRPVPGGNEGFTTGPGRYEWDKRVSPQTENPGFSEDRGFSSTAASQETTSAEGYTGGLSSDDYIKSTAIFSEVKKTVISKQFRGGEIINICGGTDINLIQADIQHPIVIDVFQLFAGTKIIIPAHWKVMSEVVSVFGEVGDRRFTHGIPHDDQKVVYIKGTSIFGGITIKNI
jgi:Predicted membrane protein (DUF2154).